MDGFLCIDKPQDVTSFQVVRRVKRSLGVQRAGHAGTLDPAATGLLLVAVGYATRLLPYLQTEPKVYEFGLRFGTETNTLDATGQVVRRVDAIPEADAVTTALSRFTGSIRQSPPRFSAVKIDGVRAYKRARKNEQFTTRERSVVIEELELREFDPDAGIAHLRVRCSGGTYVRSLARDIARHLEAAGHASYIRRTAAGEFTLAGAVEFSKLSQGCTEQVLGVREAFSHFPFVPATPRQLRALSHGQAISVPETRTREGLLFACAPDDSPVALLRRVDGERCQPIRVFASEEARMQSGEQSMTGT